MKKVKGGTCIYGMKPTCFLALIVRVSLYRTCILKETFWGVACGFGGWEVSRPAVLQMSWAVCYQVYVTWDYPRWHPLKANSQQYSWGGIWWRVRMRVCVRVRVCSCIQIGSKVWQNGNVVRTFCCAIRYHLLPLSPIRNFISQLKECRSMWGWGQCFFECVW